MYAFVIAAVGMALFFLVAASRRRRPAEILAVVLWGAYAIYEYFVANGTLCDANCNIRVDLLLFFPLLGWASYLALRKQTRTGGVVVLTLVCLLIVALLALAFGQVAVAAVAGLAALGVGAYGLKAKATSDRL